jgi:TonB family protein
MKKERKVDSFIKQPYFQGGEKALKDFVATHLVYPELARINNIEGDVSMRYEINYKGDVTDVKIIGGLDDTCNEEAIRVVKLFKFVVPKNPRGIKVTFHKNIRIHFRLNQVIPTTTLDAPTLENNQIPNQNMQLNYTIVTTTKTENQSETPKTNTYQYTINM